MGQNARGLAQDGPELSPEQARRLNRLVAFARRRSPFYARLYANLPQGAVELPQLSPVNKPEMMANFDQVITDPEVRLRDVRAYISDAARAGAPFHERYTVWSTSGSTGIPGIFLHDPGALRRYNLLFLQGLLPHFLNRPLLANLARRGLREASIISTGGHFAANSFMQQLRRLHPSLQSRLRTFSVLSPLQELVSELNAFDPTMMAGYPTALKLLAEEQRCGNLNLRPLVSLSTGEWLDPDVRQLLQSEFGGQVIDMYGCTEFPFIAFSCASGKLHLREPWVILEPVDEALRPVPAGISSHSVLLTNLVNRIQPIIRYDLGDSLTILNQPCACGSPHAALELEGRRDEILHFANRQGSSVPLLPRALASLVKETPGVHRFQIVQCGNQLLKVRLATADGIGRAWIDDEVVWRLQRQLLLHDLPNIEVQIAPEAPQRDPRTGKYRHVLCETC